MQDLWAGMGGGGLGGCVVRFIRFFILWGLGCLCRYVE